MCLKSLIGHAYRSRLVQGCVASITFFFSLLRSEYTQVDYVINRLTKMFMILCVQIEHHVVSLYHFSNEKISGTFLPFFPKIASSFAN